MPVSAPVGCTLAVVGTVAVPVASVIFSAAVDVMAPQPIVPTEIAPLFSVTPPIVFDVALELERLPLEDTINTLLVLLALEKYQFLFEVVKLMLLSVLI